MKKKDGKGFLPFEPMLDKDIVFRGKVKLHGQNGGVQITETEMAVQSRNQFLDQSNKLAKLIYSHEKYFRGLFDSSAGYKILTVFGEFAGSSIQKGVALSQLKEIIFAVFAIEVDGSLMINPDEIQKVMTKKSGLPTGIHVLPWYTDPITLNFGDEKTMTTTLEKLNQVVIAIDHEDPWVLQTFNKKGAGEGLVMYPISMCDKNGRLAKDVFPDFSFKAKGEQHRTVVAESSTSATPSVASGVDDFVKMVCTEARMKQGVENVGGLDKKNTGKFVKWVMTDVEKECQSELSASSLTFKQVSGAVNKFASKWFLDGISNT